MTTGLEFAQSRSHADSRHRQNVILQGGPTGFFVISCGSVSLMVTSFHFPTGLEVPAGLLVPRVVDKYNAKIFRVRFEKQEDVVRLQDRPKIMKPRSIRG